MPWVWIFWARTCIYNYVNVIYSLVDSLSVILSKFLVIIIGLLEIFPCELKKSRE